ncbi:MAG: ASPIC/UnbV domain-containing protein, partial [Acidobacteriota bacterium]
LMKGGSMLWRRAHTDGSYLSASDPRVHFGLADAASVDAVVVEWPRGGLETWSVPGVNRIVSLRQGSGRAIPDGMAGRHSERHY